MQRRGLEIWIGAVHISPALEQQLDEVCTNAARHVTCMKQRGVPVMAVSSVDACAAVEQQSDQVKVRGNSLTGKMESSVPHISIVRMDVGTALEQQPHEVQVRGTPLAGKVKRRPLLSSVSVDARAACQQFMYARHVYDWLLDRLAQAVAMFRHRYNWLLGHYFSEVKKDSRDWCFILGLRSSQQKTHVPDVVAI
eukprot:m.125053 g.125053  ORF g.125053 m.125053 type:complete len:195 (-) comp9366_c0_seq1:311-895(-)